LNISGVPSAVRLATGDAELFEISPFNNGLRRISDGFKVVTVQYGKEFHCEICDISVVP